MLSRCGFILIASCIGHTAFAGRQVRRSPSSQASSEEEVSNWCWAFSGNGGNWASTLSVASEALLQFLDANSPQRVNLHCAVGASSGAATTVLLRTLLSNPSFGVQADGIATLDQARQIAKALSYIALQADLNRDEIKQVAAAILKTKLADWGENAWEKNAVALDVPSSILQFGRNIAIAKHMAPDWLNTSIDVFWGSEKDMVNAYGVERVLDIPHRFSEASTRRRATREYADEQISRAMEDMASTAHKHAARSIRGLGYSDGQTNGETVDPEKANMVDGILGEKPEAGFMTTVFVHTRSSATEGVLGVQFQDSSILALMSKETAETILASKRYKKDVSECLHNSRASYACRYIIGVVDTARPMIVLPTMEPGMVKPRIDTLHNLAVTQHYNPKLGDVAQGLVSSGVSDQTLYLVLGGFVDRKQSVLLQEYYQDGRGTSDVHYVLFGKDRDPGTAVKAVTQLLTPGAEESQGAQNLYDYNEWASEVPSGTFVDAKLNWDCHASVPANMNGKSWRLRLHGIASTREALGLSPDVYDLLEDCEDQ